MKKVHANEVLESHRGDLRHVQTCINQYREFLRETLGTHLLPKSQRDHALSLVDALVELSVKRAIIVEKIRRIEVLLEAKKLGVQKRGNGK